VSGAIMHVTVKTSAGTQSYAITPGMRVLGRSGRFLDRLALRRGDILLRQGSLVQDESEDPVTVRGRVAQVEEGLRLIVVNVLSTTPGSAAQGAPRSRQQTSVVLVLLSAQSRLNLPRGQGLADLVPGQRLQATGTLNWRSHTLLLPSVVTVSGAARAPSCDTLPSTGSRGCAPVPSRSPTPTV